MTKITTILGFSIVLALVIGVVSSGTIAEAVKPLTEMIIANDETNPVPVTVENFPTPSSEVLVTNTEPIEVTVDNLPTTSEVTIENIEPIEVTGISSNPVCPDDKIQHWSTFIIEGNREIKHDTKPNIKDNETAVIDIPTDDGIISHDQIGVKAAERLSSLGYYVEVPGKRDVALTDLKPVSIGTLRNISVICAES